MLQRQPVKKLHCDKSFAVHFANVVNSANIRMIQCGCGLRFDLKTGQGMSVPGNLCGQELERDKTVQPRVFRLVDDAHPPAAQLLHDAVMRDGSPDHCAESYVGQTPKSTNPAPFADSP